MGSNINVSRSDFLFNKIGITLLCCDSIIKENQIMYNDNFGILSKSDEKLITKPSIYNNDIMYNK